MANFVNAFLQGFNAVDSLERRREADARDRKLLKSRLANDALQRENIEQAMDFRERTYFDNREDTDRRFKLQEADFELRSDNIEADNARLDRQDKRAGVMHREQLNAIEEAKKAERQRKDAMKFEATLAEVLSNPSNRDLAPHQAANEVMRRMIARDPSFGVRAAEAFNFDAAAGPMVNKDDPVAGIAALEDGRMMIAVNTPNGPAPGTVNRTSEPDDVIYTPKFNGGAMIDLFGESYMNSSVATAQLLNQFAVDINRDPAAANNVAEVVEEAPAEETTQVAPENSAEQRWMREHNAMTPEERAAKYATTDDRSQFSKDLNNPMNPVAGVIRAGGAAVDKVGGGGGQIASGVKRAAGAIQDYFTAEKPSDVPNADRRALAPSKAKTEEGLAEAAQRVPAPKTPQEAQAAAAQLKARNGKPTRSDDVWNVAALVRSGNVSLAQGAQYLKTGSWGPEGEPKIYQSGNNLVMTQGGQVVGRTTVSGEAPASFNVDREKKVRALVDDSLGGIENPGRREAVAQRTRETLRALSGGDRQLEDSLLTDPVFMGRANQRMSWADAYQEATDGLFGIDLLGPGKGTRFELDIIPYAAQKFGIKSSDEFIDYAKAIKPALKNMAAVSGNNVSPAQLNKHIGLINAAAADIMQDRKVSRIKALKLATEEYVAEITGGQ